MADENKYLLSDGVAVEPQALIGQNKPVFLPLRDRSRTNLLNKLHIKYSSITEAQGHHFLTGFEKLFEEIILDSPIHLRTVWSSILS